MKRGGHYIAILDFSPPFRPSGVSFESSRRGGNVYPGFVIFEWVVPTLFALEGAILQFWARFGLLAWWGSLESRGKNPVNPSRGLQHIPSMYPRCWEIRGPGPRGTRRRTWVVGAKHRIWSIKVALGSVPVFTIRVGVSLGPLHGTVLSAFSSEIRFFGFWRPEQPTTA